MPSPKTIMQSSLSAIGKLLHLSNPEEAKATVEEMKGIIDDAVEFDKLAATAGWSKVNRFVMQHIDNSIIEATEKKYEPSIQAVLVTRWDAKRELWDGLIGYMQGVQKSRDAIVEEFKHGPRPE